MATCDLPTSATQVAARLDLLGFPNGRYRLHSDDYGRTRTLSISLDELTHVQVARLEKILGDALGARHLTLVPDP